jgi:metallo-beta-lactamase family protein
LRWLGGFRDRPKRLFLTHGEEQVSLALAEHLRSTLGWEAVVPHYQDVAELDQ